MLSVHEESCKKLQKMIFSCDILLHKRRCDHTLVAFHRMSRVCTCLACPYWPTDKQCPLPLSFEALAFASGSHPLATTPAKRTPCRYNYDNCTCLANKLLP
ncbi:unnamed protein product [Ectocarpus sp. 12 AP-2014]